MAGLAGIEDLKANILQLVADWLTSEASGRWLLFIDNADDGKVFFDNIGDLTGGVAASVSKPTLFDYLPRSPKGSIIFTTRNKQAGLRLLGGLGYVTYVPKMSESESEKLLSQELREIDSDIGRTTELLDLLEHLPIAVIQAAAYIRKQSMTISDYLDLYHDQDSVATELLDEDFEDLRRDAKAVKSVFKTWVISFGCRYSHRPFLRGHRHPTKF